MFCFGDCTTSAFHATPRCFSSIVWVEISLVLSIALQTCYQDCCLADIVLNVLMLNVPLSDRADLDCVLDFSLQMDELLNIGPCSVCAKVFYLGTS